MIIRVNVWAGLLSRTSRPIGREAVATAQDLSPQFDPDLITFTPRLLSWDSSEAGGDDHMQFIWASMRWGGAYNHLTLLSWFAVSIRRGEICRAMFLCRGSLWGDWALARREKRRGDPGPCVSAHPAAVTRGSVPDSAWCLLGQLSPLDVETSRARPRAQHSSHFHLSSLAGRCHKNQILRQDF